MYFEIEASKPAIDGNENLTGSNIALAAGIR